MLTRDKLEYQKRLRFLREAKAKTASEKLKLATKAEESDLTKRMVTLGDEENRIPARGETPKEYNQTPKTGEESLVKDPIEAGDKKEKKIDFDLDLMDVVQLKEAKKWYVFKVSEGPNDEPYDGLGLEMLDIEPQYYSDKREAEVVADMLIDAEDVDFDVAPVGKMIWEASPPQKDADQSLSRFKKRKKAVRTKSMKRKSHAKLDESNLDALLKECGCEMESPFDAPEGEPQGYMLVQNLRRIADKAGEMSGLAKVEDDAEPWVESKINSAADDIGAVYDYIKYGRPYNKHDAEEHHHEEEMMYEGNMNVKESELKKMIREAVKAKLQELSSFNKEELPGSGDMPALMKEFDDLLLQFSKDALELHAKMVEEMKVDMLGGTAAPQMSPRIGERNRMLTVRAGLLRKLAANCTAAIEAARREG